MAEIIATIVSCIALGIGLIIIGIRKTAKDNDGRDIDETKGKTTTSIILYILGSILILIGLFVLYYNFPRSEYEYEYIPPPINYTNQIG